MVNFNQLSSDYEPKLQNEKDVIPRILELDN